MNVLPAWRSCINGTGVTVGVVDKGVQDHIDLKIVSIAWLFSDCLISCLDIFFLLQSLTLMVDLWLFLFKLCTPFLDSVRFRAWHVDLETCLLLKAVCYNYRLTFRQLWLFFLGLLSHWSIPQISFNSYLNNLFLGCFTKCYTQINRYKQCNSAKYYSWITLKFNIGQSGWSFQYSLIC